MSKKIKLIINYQVKSLVVVGITIAYFSVLFVTMMPAAKMLNTVVTNNSLGKEILAFKIEGKEVVGP